MGPPAVCLFYEKGEWLMWDFINSWTFIIVMAVVLVALVGILLFLRNQRPD
jgi:hypothetical protein